MAKVNIRIRHNRSGTPYTGGLTLGNQGEEGFHRKLEPGEVVTVDDSIFEALPSVREMTEVVTEGATRPLTFPDRGTARATSTKFLALDENSGAIKNAADKWLKDWQKANKVASRKAAKAEVGESGA